MLRILILLALISLSPSASTATELPPLQEVRACAENEPALGALITFPTALPYALMREIAEDDVLYVLVDDAEAQGHAVRALARNGVDMAHVEFIVAPSDTIWTRDWSAAAAFQHGQHTLVDSIFLAYTLDAAEGGSITQLGMQHLDDDVSPVAVAAHTGVQHVDAPFHLVGGNYDTDGLGNAFCTELLVDENRMWGVPGPDLRSGLEDELGIRDLRVLPNFAIFDLQHIDCALKVVGEETLIITRPPASHASYPYFEALALAAASYRTPFGRRYEIHRINAPVFKGSAVGGEVANYANSLILNGKVLVPMFGLPSADARALRIYEEAMPGHEVIGYLFEDSPLMGPSWSWQSFDSVHCRTKQVFDPGMLLLKPRRVRGASAGSPIEVRTLIRAYSNTPIVDPTLAWRVAGSTDWVEVPLAPGAHAEEFVGLIPAQGAGVTIEYFVRASDGSGRTEARPPRAPEGSYAFTVH